MNIVTICIIVVVIYLLYRTLVPWVRVQVTIAKAISDNKQEAPDLDEAISNLIDIIQKEEEDE